MKNLISCSFIFFLINTSLYSQINTEILRKEPVLNELNHLINTQINVVKGNSNFLSYKINYRADIATKTFKSFLVLSLNEIKTPDTLINQYHFIHWRIQFPLSPSSSYELFTQQEYNPLINLKNRQLMGLNLRHKHNLLNKFIKNNSLFIGNGLMLEYQTYLYSPKTTSMRFNQYINFESQLTTHTIFKTISYYQPNLDNLSDFKILLESMISTTISKHISFNTHCNLYYNNMPTENIKKYDLEIIQSINFSFKNMFKNSI